MADALAVVTGGAAGLGAHISRALARQGLTVVLADTDGGAATRLIEDLRTEGLTAHFVDTDAGDAAAVHRLMSQVADIGTLQVLVNNAGGWLPGPQFPDSDQWRRSLDLNLVMPMLACQLSVPLMRGHGGAVVNVSSSGGWGSRAYGSPEYGAAKAGLIRFTTSVADWADRYGIRVNCVVPHWIGLDRAVQQFSQMNEDERRRSGGLVDPRLVANTVAALTQDPNSNARIVVLRAGLSPYDIDPGSADPHD